MIILIFTKRNYDSEMVKDEEKRGCDYKQFEIIDNGDQEPKSTKKEETEAKKQQKMFTIIRIMINVKPLQTKKLII